MPQFDYITFFNQTSWIFIVLLTFLIFLSKYVIPFLGTVLKIREKRFFFYKNFFFDIFSFEKIFVFNNLELAYENFFNTMFLLISIFIESTFLLKNKLFILFKDKLIINYLKKIIKLNILIFFFKYMYLKKKLKKFKVPFKNRYRKKKFTFFLKFLNKKSLNKKSLNKKSLNKIIKKKK